jgi:hypothetical protein
VILGYQMPPLFLRLVASFGMAANSAHHKILSRNLEPFSLDDFDFVMNVNVRGKPEINIISIPVCSVFEKYI